MSTNNNNTAELSTSSEAAVASAAAATPTSTPESSSPADPTTPSVAETTPSTPPAPSAPAATSTPSTPSTPSPPQVTSTPAETTTPNAPVTTSTSVPAATSSEPTPPASVTSTSTPDASSTTAEPTITSAGTTTLIFTTESIASQDGTAVSTVMITSTVTNAPVSGTDGGSAASETGASIQSSGSSSSSNSNAGVIAAAVVVPVAAVALFVALGIWLWKKRKARMAAEEERRKEVEDYQYNPNADPTLPGSGSGGGYEMKEDSSSGYRGWGSTTLGGSTGRKASTTMSGGAAPAFSESPHSEAGFSDPPSPTRATHEPLMSDAPEGEILGAMGPNTAHNRGAVKRGPSNASSSYSAGAPSDGSGEIGMAYGETPGYTQYDPYSDSQYGSPPGGQPVIRDNPARRNTRIENPAHYPQQVAGISQNF